MVHQAHPARRTGLGITMAWYWYITGACTVLFVESVLFNLAQYKGWVKFSKSNEPVVRRIYDQDNSGSHKRAV
jgi:hypothetical protein